MPADDFKRIFRGKDGHRIDVLADQSRLRALLVANSTKLDDELWARMCHKHRPYSARYGSEDPSKKDAEDEVKTTESIVGLIQKVLGTP